MQCVSTHYAHVVHTPELNDRGAHDVHKTVATEGVVPQNEGIMINYTRFATATSHGRTSHILINSSLLAVALLVLGAFVIPPPEVQAATGTPCHTITSSATVLPAQYGSPINYFALIPTPMLTVTCDTLGVATAHVESSNAETYIYQYGFQRVDGKWKRFTFTGVQNAGPWVLQNAEAIIPEPTTGEGKIIAYVCQKVNGAWKCGCRDQACTRPYWQVQTYNPSATSVVTLPTMTIGDSNLTDPYVAELEEKFGFDFSSTKYNKYSEEAEQSLIDGAKEVFNIYQIVGKHVKRGESIMISGYDFSTSKDGNAVLFDGTQVASVQSLSGKSLTVTVPQNVTVGKHEVRVRRDGKTTPDYATLWVTDGTAQTPTLTRVSPETGEQGGVFHIYGTHLTSDADIATTFGVLHGVATQDGTQLTFTFDPFDEPVYFRNTDGTRSYYQQQVWVTVVNGGGTSNTLSIMVTM